MVWTEDAEWTVRHPEGKVACDTSMIRPKGKASCLSVVGFNPSLLKEGPVIRRRQKPAVGGHELSGILRHDRFLVLGLGTL